MASPNFGPMDRPLRRSIFRYISATSAKSSNSKYKFLFLLDIKKEFPNKATIMDSQPVHQNVSVNNVTANMPSVQEQPIPNMASVQAVATTDSGSKAGDFAKSALDTMKQAATSVLHFAEEKGIIVRDFLFSHPESALYAVAMAAGLLACCCHAFPLTSILTWSLTSFMGDCLTAGLIFSVSRLMCEAVSAKIAERVQASCGNMTGGTV